MEEEKKRIAKLDLLEIIKYIKDSFDIIVSIKLDNVIKKQNDHSKIENTMEDYENLLRKEEATIRQHISIEQQMKLHLEKLLEKLEKSENERENIIKKIVRN